MRVDGREQRTDRVLQALRLRGALASGWVFPSSASESGHLTTVAAQWRCAREKAGLDHALKLYCCRHTFATELLYATKELSAGELAARRADLAASYQHAIVRALTERVHEAARQIGAQRIAIVGGVAANSELREALPDATAAPLPLCTDNAAMIASAARWTPEVPYPRYLALDAYASR